MTTTNKTTHLPILCQTNFRYSTPVSNIGCEKGVVNVCDSLYESIDGVTRESVLNIFEASLLILVESQKQEG